MFVDFFGNIVQPIVERAENFSGELFKFAVEIRRGIVELRDDFFLEREPRFGKCAKAFDERFAERAQILVNDALIVDDFADILRNFVLILLRRSRAGTRRVDDKRKRCANLPDEQHRRKEHERSRAVIFLTDVKQRRADRDDENKG